MVEEVIEEYEKYGAYDELITYLNQTQLEKEIILLLNQVFYMLNINKKN